MRNRAGGILIENGKVLLIHRIKDNDEYYVFPGGGIETNETIEQATKRELLEEAEIKVELIEKNPRYILKNESGIQYFSLVKRVKGIIGTGKGPEFTDKSYEKHGKYIVEMISIKDIANGKINLVPLEIKEKFLKDFYTVF